jgi:hypothetical protein
LANVYLHYVFDLWVDHWRHRHAQGDVIVVRFADDFVVGFQYRSDAEKFLDELKDRFLALARSSSGRAGSRFVVGLFPFAVSSAGLMRRAGAAGSASAFL